VSQRDCAIRKFLYRGVAPQLRLWLRQPQRSAPTMPPDDFTLLRALLDHRPAAQRNANSRSHKMAPCGVRKNKRRNKIPYTVEQKTFRVLISRNVSGLTKRSSSPFVRRSPNIVSPRQNSVNPSREGRAPNFCNAHSPMQQFRCDEIRRIVAINKNNPKRGDTWGCCVFPTGRHGGTSGVPPHSNVLINNAPISFNREAGFAYVHCSFKDGGATHRHPGPSQSVQQSSSTPAQSAPSRRVPRDCSCTPRGINTHTPWRDIHSQPLPSTASSFLDPASWLGRRLTF
jgi:hypothetical protein